MSLAVIACLILGLPAAGADAPAPRRLVADTLRYTVLMAGNGAGSQVVWRDATGALRTHLEYNDRRRSPNLDQTITLDSLYDPAALYRALGVDPSQESTPTP